MTSRRSMMAYSERVSRALQFVPGHVGGRVASAQPIRRRGGTLRSASVGAAGAPAEPEWLDGALKTLGGGTTSSDIGSVFAGTAGNVLVAFWAGSKAITAPAGWTTVDSGTVGTLLWGLITTEVTGTDDLVLTAASSGVVAVIVYKFGPTPLTVAATTPYEAAATTATFAIDQGAGLLFRYPFIGSYGAAGFDFDPTSIWALPGINTAATGDAVAFGNHSPYVFTGGDVVPAGTIDVVSLAAGWV